MTVEVNVATSEVTALIDDSLGQVEGARRERMAAETEPLEPGEVRMGEAGEGEANEAGGVSVETGNEAGEGSGGVSVETGNEAGGGEDEPNEAGGGEDEPNEAGEAGTSRARTGKIWVCNKRACVYTNFYF
ncbi:MAG: hypothetical protein E6Q06_02110 [Candidatus Moraniibacteriota bacterium]|nr:MAG: hypothetical protein E6Q06_02110 [Candidatus Moranbacteria bacterium]